MRKWLLPTISEILARSEQTGADSAGRFLRHKERKSNSRRSTSRVKAEREWCCAIAALEELLLPSLQCERSPFKGLVLAGPSPVLSHPDLITAFQTRIFTAESFNTLALMPFQRENATAEQTEATAACHSKLPLLPADPLSNEQFCVVFAPGFSLVMALGEDITGDPAFQFSFDPEVVEAAWNSLRSRLLLSSPHTHCHQLDALVEQFPPTAPDYRTVTQFSRQLLKHLPSVECDSSAVKELDSETSSDTPNLNSAFPVSPYGTRQNHAMFPEESISPKIASKSHDVELLQAFAHEVRTPLTTIRTLTRLLLKRRNLAPDIIKRLEVIDHECTEQINRMELIFRAVELETSENKHWQGTLIATSLTQLLQQSIPHWQKQAARRNLTLDVVLPQKLPTVVCNPAMLEQALTGVIENFTRSLPAGGHIQVEVTPAGNQLKLQLVSQPDPEKTNGKQDACFTGINKGVKSIGQMLMFQPETGNLSLNLDVTKSLFQALGGKLIVRQRPQQGEVLTIFLPLDVGNTTVWKA